jgi:hypothetical protein
LTTKGHQEAFQNQTLSPLGPLGVLGGKIFPFLRAFVVNFSVFP